MSANSFPLHWPEGWPRTRTPQPARFQSFRQSISLPTALNRLFGELRLLGVDADAATTILSTNVRVTLRGTPDGKAATPRDAGVALYFKLNGKDRVLACDKWLRVADNVAAIAAHINAIRKIDRYGVGTMDQVFAGYAALPPRGGTWRATLGFEFDALPTPDEIHHAYVDRAKVAHPDKAGGSAESMAALNAARDAGLQEYRERR